MSARPEGPLRFSVVVPAHDEAADLGAALDALLAQDLDASYEVLVVDNASTDATAEVARSRGVRVVPEPRLGVCQARQTGVEAARGEVVASTDADSVVPHDWLSRIDATLRADPRLVAVAGPCRYADPPWWAAVFPPAFFVVVDHLHAGTGRLLYLTATNVAFRREGFPGYDVRLTQGGDEVDLRRRLQAWGPVAWDGRLVVDTSSRRMDFGLAHTVIVSFGYHYGLNYALGRLLRRRVLGPAPAIRADQARSARRWRRGWRVVAAVTTAVLVIRAARRHNG
ncbi:Glycosyltransferase involved in cell wall bisynthesis [Microlunatus sagamiharensis]|uniref:4,4'-diaponeurosporenoate glycosyltransferase n=1 Tax=Microlunatus sagamiharensis TaxID=546874 RepID=A0A1H2MB65_9ACTN|nr:glycosyltransferase family A protein [Microlunatus sagamiharensis]SDU90500.1 Glycosyltransferase involved in cell wall bisynthesis [Microlunatus sagamiharensis]